MSTKFSAAPPPTQKPPVCKYTPPPPILPPSPSGILVATYAIDSIGPGPLYTVNGTLLLRRRSPNHWYAAAWPTIPDGQTAHFEYLATTTNWRVHLRHFTSSFLEFESFTLYAPYTAPMPFYVGPIQMLSAEIAGPQLIWIADA